MRSAPSLTLALTLAACAASRTAPAPPMGDLSGPWLLETAGEPVRFVNAQGDTTSLTVSREPLLLRQGKAVSDTSITLDIAGILVSGARKVSAGLRRKADAELVTAGTSKGRLTFFAPSLAFTGRWSEDGFVGEYRVDPAQAGRDIVVLDEPRAWSLRRLGSGAR